MRKLLLLSVFTAVTTFQSGARFTAIDAFENAPLAVIPLIDHTKRIEMVRLYEAGMAEKAAPNVLGGPTALISADDDAVSLREGNGSTMTLALLPMNGGDTAVMILENLATPAIDANIRLYTRDWHEISGAYTEPCVADWAIKSRRREASEIIPFMLAEGTWNPTSQTVTLTPTVSSWIDEELRERVPELIHDSLQLKWNGKKFIIKK